MRTKILILVSLMITNLMACNSLQSAPFEPTHQMMTTAWQADAHAIWQLEWPAAPISGPVTVATWQAGDLYRYEILESPAPALIGQTLLFDGTQGWQYNRFAPPDDFTPVNNPHLSPISEAWAQVDALLADTPSYATRQPVTVNNQPADNLTLHYPNGNSLSIWTSRNTGLPLRVIALIGGQSLTLAARYIEPLTAPPAQLFSVGNWLRH